MPCPFPGMDPYLEGRGVFPGFHNSFAGHIHDWLNRRLPRPYYALLESRQELGIGAMDDLPITKPDVALMHDPWALPGGGTATLTEADVRTEVSVSIELDAIVDPANVYFLEIRDASSGHALITLIEILSRSNKLLGQDRQDYLDTRTKIFGSQTSLIEIDLLRSGQRAAHEPDYALALQELVPACPYFVAVNRSWKRGKLARRGYQIFPIQLREPLPVISIPLRQGEPEPTLDLQYLFRETYAAGPYQRGAVNYVAAPPPPPLSAEDLAWVRERITSYAQ